MLYEWTAVCLPLQLPWNLTQCRTHSNWWCWPTWTSELRHLVSFGKLIFWRRVKQWQRNINSMDEGRQNRKRKNSNIALKRNFRKLRTSVTIIKVLQGELMLPPLKSNCSTGLRYALRGHFISTAISAVLALRSPALWRRSLTQLWID